MLSEMYGSSCELPTVPTSADGELKLRPGSMSAGFGRVMVLDKATRTTALSDTFIEALAEGSQFSYSDSVSTKLTTFGYRLPSKGFGPDAGAAGLRGSGKDTRPPTVCSVFTQRTPAL